MGLSAGFLNRKVRSPICRHLVDDELACERVVFAVGDQRVAVNPAEMDVFEEVEARTQQGGGERSSTARRRDNECSDRYCGQPTVGHYASVYTTWVKGESVAWVSAIAMQTVPRNG